MHVALIWPLHNTEGIYETLDVGRDEPAVLSIFCTLPCMAGGVWTAQGFSLNVEESRHLFRVCTAPSLCFTF